MPTQSTSASATYWVLPFTYNGEVWTIDQGVTVSSIGDTLNTNNYLACGVINQGSIASSGGYGIMFFNSDSSFATNYGSVLGGVGIAAYCDGVNVTNHGSVTGFDGAGINFFGQSNSTGNDGTISGSTDGVVAFSGSAAIDNWAGSISGGHYGIDIETSIGGGPSEITNAAGALIKGTSGSIFAGTSQSWVYLLNNGTLKGDVDLSASAMGNAITNGGTINGSIYFGKGNDLYSGESGGVVTNAIHGGAGDDRFISGSAKEVYWGGTGADTFVFNGVGDSPNTAKHDVIEDFSHSQGDKIDVHAIDADVTHAGTQHFVFIGTDTFADYHSTHPKVFGMLRFDETAHQLQGNDNTNFSTAEFAVDLPSVTTLHASDLILA